MAPALPGCLLTKLGYQTTRTPWTERFTVSWNSNRDEKLKHKQRLILHTDWVPLPGTGVPAEPGLGYPTERTWDQTPQKENGIGVPPLRVERTNTCENFTFLILWMRAVMSYHENWWLYIEKNTYKKVYYLAPPWINHFLMISWCEIDLLCEQIWPQTMSKLPFCTQVSATY